MTRLQDLFPGDGLQDYPGIVADATRAPTTADIYNVGAQWYNVTTGLLYETTGGGVWTLGGNSLATTTTPGIVTLFDTDSFAGATDTTVPTSLTVKTYVDATVIAGAPVATTTTSGIGRLVSDANAVARLASTGAQAYFVQPSNLTAVMSAPGPIGDTTASTAAFTTLSTDGTGTVNLASSGDVIASTTTGSFTVTAGENVTDAISLNATAGGLQILASAATAGEDIVITATGSSVRITATESAVDAVNIESTLGGIKILASGAAAGEDIVVTATGSSIRLTATESATDSINIESTLGGINILSSGAAAGEDINIIATGSSVNLEATENAALAIYLHANGGTSETIRLRADQGTGVDSIDVLSDVGGVTITAGVASADAINIVASDAAGGIDIDSGTAGIAIDTSGAFVLTDTKNAAASIYLRANGGTSETIKIHADQGTGVASLDLLSDVGGITLTGGVASADAINIVASDAAGGIDVDSGTAGMTFDTTGAFVVTDTKNAAAAIYLRANGGTSETVKIHADQGTGVASIDVLSDVGGITLTSGLASGAAINIVASDAAGGIDIDAGTAGFIVDTTGAFSIDGAAASNVTVTGAGVDLTLASTLGSVLVSSTENAALAIKLHANGGTSETIQIHADQGTGVGSVNLLSDVGGLTLRATGLVSDDAINLEAPVGGVDVDAAMQISIVTTETDADSMVLTSGGGIDITATGAAAKDIDVVCTSGSINLTAGESIANAMVLNSSGAAGGIDLTTGGGSIDLSSAGSVTMVAGTDSQAGAACTINKNVFAATFTGFTTAAGATQTFTITNSVITTTSQILLTISNLGANDAQMTVRRVKQLAGSVEVYTINNGALALNGNVVITGWVIG